LAKIQLNLLGEFEIRSPDGRVFHLSSKKAKAMLACLGVAFGRPVPRAKMATMLWGDRGDEQARGSLRQTLSVLRKGLDDAAGDILGSVTDCLSLDSERVRCDVAEFESLAESGGLEDLKRAASLYRGAFLDGFDLRDAVFDEWLRAERRRLSDLHARVLSDLVITCERDGEIAAALSYAGGLLDIDPLREDAHRMAMRLHWREGNRYEALRQYRECESVLASELGVAPQEETRALYEEIHAARILAATPSGVSVSSPASAEARITDSMQPGDTVPSIAVLPFSELVSGVVGGGLGDAFAQDIIVELSRRRWLTVIARGSTFQFQAGDADLSRVENVLGVRYVLTGSSHAEDGNLRITAELADCETGHVLWAEVFERSLSDVFAVRRAVSERVAASVLQEIEQAEMIRTRDLEPADLGAWGRYHKGLWHAFRFNSDDNEVARRLFTDAVDGDPAFSNAYAALSFTHFQRAYLLYSQWTQEEIRTAISLAERSLDLDPRNPRGHYAYGRACMLDNRPEASFEALETSLRLEPGFAQGHYSLGFVQAQCGDPEAAIRNLRRAAELSPIDPLVFAMISSQAFCHMRVGNYGEAASCAIRGAGKPHAHVQAFAVAAAMCQLAGREDDATAHAEVVRGRSTGYSIENFLAAFPSFNADDRETITAPLRDLGFT
jgi:DNA-binding SARP family transcriptional activator/Tfp pilus assembly protein PilF